MLGEVESWCVINEILIFSEKPPRRQRGSQSDAQVAIIADKYNCASLYKLARRAFGNAVKNINPSEWAVIAGFIIETR